MLGSILAWEALGVMHTPAYAFETPWVGKKGAELGLLHGAGFTRMALWPVKVTVDTIGQLVSGGRIKPYTALQEIIGGALGSTEFFGKSTADLLMDRGLIQKSSYTTFFGQANAPRFSRTTGQKILSGLSFGYFGKGNAANYSLTQGGLDEIKKIFGKAGDTEAQVIKRASKVLNIEMINGEYAIRGFKKGGYRKAYGWFGIGGNEALKKFGAGFVKDALGKYAGAALSVAGWSLLADVVAMPFDLARSYEGWNPMDKRLSNSFEDPMWGMHHGAATQRQAALSALHNSQMSVRAILGNEAGFLH